MIVNLVFQTIIFLEMIDVYKRVESVLIAIRNDICHQS